MSLQDLRLKIKKKEAHLAVIGLGYVGLPVACEFAKAGFQVIGIEKRADRVEMINSGVSPIEGDEPGLQELLAEVTATRRLKATTDYRMLTNCDVILIDVETPVDENNIPRYNALRSALEDLGPVLKDQALVIIESTISPGTIEKVALPILTQTSGKELNRDFYLGNCPERVMPGKLLQNLNQISRVLGGMSPETASVMADLYRNVVRADLDLADCITAELVKTTENAYRDVQIAFANEVAMICEAVGADVWKVRELVNKSPYRNMHLPGAGVGGHCIPKDPWLLVNSVKDMGLSLKIIPAARQINNSMPLHVIALLENALQASGRSLSNSCILVLGYAYLENSDDVRNSPSEVLVNGLREKCAKVVIHDPFVREYQADLFEAAKGCDAVIVMVKHNEYLHLDLDQLRSILRTPILIDGRNLFTPEQAISHKFQYRGIGQGNHHSV
jgi:UDP-N-acetyl-D-mannosaminuronic acid dehydrogenase